MESISQSNFYYPRHPSKIQKENKYMELRLKYYDQIKKRIKKVYSTKSVSKRKCFEQNITFPTRLSLNCVQTFGKSISLKKKYEPTHKSQGAQKPF